MFQYYAIPPFQRVREMTFQVYSNTQTGAAAIFIYKNHLLRLVERLKSPPIRIKTKQHENITLANITKTKHGVSPKQNCVARSPKQNTVSSWWTYVRCGSGWRHSRPLRPGDGYLQHGTERGSAGPATLSYAIAGGQKTGGCCQAGGGSGLWSSERMAMRCDAMMMLGPGLQCSTRTRTARHLALTLNLAMAGCWARGAGGGLELLVTQLRWGRRTSGVAGGRSISGGNRVRFC